VLPTLVTPPPCAWMCWPFYAAQLLSETWGERHSFFSLVPTGAGGGEWRAISTYDLQRRMDQTRQTGAEE